MTNKVPSSNKVRVRPTAVVNAVVNEAPFMECTKMSKSAFKTSLNLFRINQDNLQNDYICIWFDSIARMITVNESARAQVQKLLAEQDMPSGSFVRVGVKGGGCSGLMYELAFDHEEREGDQVFEDNGVKVVVDKKSFLYLVGTELRYSGGLNGKGFEFHNPNANRTCGCGESFSL